MRHAARFMCAALVMSLASAAAAQISVDDVTFGWGKLYLPQRWIPLTLKVSGGPAGFSGTVQIEYQQDATQRAIVSAPIAATPGATTDIQIPICPLGALQPVDIRIVGPDGTAYRQQFSQTPSPRSLYLDLEQPIGGQLVLLAGEGSSIELTKNTGDPNPKPNETTKVLPNGAVVMPGIGDSEEPTDPAGRLALLWKNSKCVQRGLGQLPSDAVLYDAFACVVLSENSSDPGAATLGAREAAALRTWVNAGGWLVVLAGPGEQWRRWVSDDDGSTPIELSPLTNVPTPPEMVAIVKDLPLGVPAGDPVAPADHVIARAITIPPDAKRQGWQAGWKSPEGSVLLAHGPVGLGMVSVLGVDPRAGSRVVSSASARAIWRDALKPAMEPHARPGIQLVMPSWSPMMNASGSSDRQSRAIAAASDAVATAPSVGIGIFIGIAGAMTLLTLVIGPGDAIVLKMLGLRHRSWLVALGWIGAASLGAYVLPLFFRSGPSSVAQLSVIDQVCRSDSTVAAIYRTTVTGIYAQRRARFDLADPARGVAPGSFARGISSRPAWSGVTNVFPALAAAIGGSAGARFTALAGVDVPQWTFRTILEEGPGAGPTAKAARTTGDQVEIGVQGLPANARITDAAIEFKGSRHVVDPTPHSLHSGATGFETLPGDRIQKLTGSPDEPPIQPEMDIPGADRRGESVTWRQKHGEYAVLYLQLQDAPSIGAPRASAGELKTTHTIWYRILVPLPPSGETP